MYDPDHQQRVHQVLIWLLCLYPVGVVRTYFVLRTEKGKALPTSVKAGAFIVPFLCALGVLLYLLYGQPT